MTKTAVLPVVAPPLPSRREVHGHTSKNSRTRQGERSRARGGKSAALILAVGIAGAGIAAGAPNEVFELPEIEPATITSPIPSAAAKAEANEAIDAAAGLMVSEASASPEIVAAAQNVAELRDELLDAPTDEVIADHLAEATAELIALIGSAEVGHVEVVAAPNLTTLQRLAAKAWMSRSELAEFANSLADYANGRIPASSMTRLSWADEHMLRTDAAAQFELLNQAFHAEFGRNIGVTDSYRSHEGQVACRRAKGSWCATPGTSNHGWGTAVDLNGGINDFGSAEHNWMRENAPYFGWIHPSWARAGGSKPEPWHWEFHPEEQIEIEVS